MAGLSRKYAMNGGATLPRLRRKASQLLRNALRTNGKSLFGAAPLTGLVAVLLTLFLLSGSSRASSCFPEVYYELLFTPVAQQALPGGDTRLMGYSDHLAAKGEDPKDHQGSGCMCGVNNGRWDQVLFNGSLKDASRPPVAFRLNGLSGQLFDRKDKPLAAPFSIDAASAASCLNAGLKAGQWKPYNAGAGVSPAPGLVEPGENLLGCLCLRPEDQRKSGYVKLRVDYTPVVPTFTLPGPGAVQQAADGKTVLRQSIKLGPLAAGAARYYALEAPKGVTNASVELKLAQQSGLVLYTAKQWGAKTEQWQAGGFKGPLQAKEPLLIMARALDSQAKGALELRLSWAGSPARLAQEAASPRLEETGPRAWRAFKVFVLGMGYSSKAKSGFDTAPTRSCCYGKP